jgi:hypothetical protein
VIGYLPKLLTNRMVIPAYINNIELKEICLINIKGITRLKKYNICSLFPLNILIPFSESSSSGISFFLNF